MATLIRKIARKENELYFDIVYFLEITLPKLDENFTFQVLTEENMGDCHGLTYPDKNLIQIRQDVYERAVEGNGRDRLTLAHELFHLLQHESINISFARTGNNKVETYRDPEWQSDAFGGELLVPHNMIQGMSINEVATKCGVSMAAARFQLSKL